MRSYNLVYSLAGRSDFVEWNRVTGIEFDIHVVFYTTWKRKKREYTESAVATAQGYRIDNAHNSWSSEMARANLHSTAMKRLTPFVTGHSTCINDPEPVGEWTGQWRPNSPLRN